ncbi:MAG: DUF547 domain-containing protein, partial [Natronomonas sp.]
MTDRPTVDATDSRAETRSDDGRLRPTEAATGLLEALRTDGDPERYLAALADYGHDDLRRIRDDRSAGLAFWINLYNAGTQRLLAERPELYDSALRFLRFFRATAVTVAGTELSLDDIEMGILRGRRSKYGLGYLPRFPRQFERRYALAVDPRIHFACNCGAASCPAIRFYTAENVEEQLDLAAETYLDSTVEYDPDTNVARIPRVFLWYRGDFDGRTGIRQLLRAYDAIPAEATPRFRYRSWDWSKA